MDLLSRVVKIDSRHVVTTVAISDLLWVILLMIVSKAESDEWSIHRLMMRELAMAHLAAG